MICKEYRLGEICKVYQGLSFKLSNYSECGVPVLKLGNIDDGKVIKRDSFYCDEKELRVLDKYKVRYGDVVMTNHAPAGKVKVGVNLTDSEFILSRHIFKFDPDPNILDRKYLYYFLVNSPSQVDQLVSFKNVSSINVSSMEEFKIRVPDLETQRNIVRQLDAFQELREELRMRKQQGVYYRNKIMRSLQERLSLEE